MMTTFSDPHSQELYFEAKRNPVRITDRCVALEIALKASKATADRRLELLVMAEQTLRNIGANLPPESDLAHIAKNAAFNIKKELDDTALGS